MPLCYTPINAAALNRGLVRLLRPRPNNTSTSTSHLNHLFHTSRILQDDTSSPHSQNHYDTLNVPPDASPSEIKKSFYALSKKHHPDINPSDPHASRRFTRISEAYSILSNTTKRHHYDSQHPHLRRRHKQPPHSPPSYSASGPAGGRPASGLSSRSRGTFQGPPPSFFRSGGWGSHSPKRRAAHESTTGASGTKYNPETNRGNPGAASGEQPDGGMGPGQRPHPSAWNDAPRHFDKEGHERTHRRADERREKQRKEKAGLGADGDTEAEGDMGRLAIVSGVLIAAVVGPALAVWAWRGMVDWASSGGGRRKREES